MFITNNTKEVVSFYIAGKETTINADSGCYVDIESIYRKFKTIGMGLELFIGKEDKEGENDNESN